MECGIFLETLQNSADGESRVPTQLASAEDDVLSQLVDKPRRPSSPHLPVAGVDTLFTHIRDAAEATPRLLLRGLRRPAFRFQILDP